MNDVSLGMLKSWIRTLTDMSCVTSSSTLGRSDMCYVNLSSKRKIWHASASGFSVDFSIVIDSSTELHLTISASEEYIAWDRLFEQK